MFFRTAGTSLPALADPPVRSDAGAPCGDDPAPRLGWRDVATLLGDTRAMARRLLRGEAHAQSMPTMALVLTGLRRQKLADQAWDDVSWRDREHFLAAMYRAMDRALTDHGRRRRAHKRGWLRHAVDIAELSDREQLSSAGFQPHDDVERAWIDRPEVGAALADALRLLEARHPEWAAVARHRYYGGLTVEQTASVMHIGERTVRRHWDKARVLLHDQIVQALREARLETPG